MYSVSESTVSVFIILPSDNWFIDVIPSISSYRISSSDALANALDGTTSK